MKKSHKIMAGVAAGLAIIPLAMLVIRKMKAAKAAAEEEGTPVVNHLFSSYRGKHKPHHRKNGVDGKAAM